MAVRFVNPFIQWVNGSSVVESGAKLYFYDTGTSTPKTTYSDSALSVANANPVVADANGKFGDIFLSTAQYKVVLKTSADVTIWTADPVGDSLEDVTVTGAFALSGKITPSQITADQNNYNPPGLSTAVSLRLSTDASRNITGLSGGVAGRVFVVRNIGSFNIVLKDESASSTAANRFALSSDVTLGADQVAMLQYDEVSSRWLVIGSPFTLTLAGIQALVTTHTRQVLLSGSAATYTTPAGVRYLKIRMIGGGAGGAGSGTGPTNGGSGVTTAFNSINAAAGSGGIDAGAGGAGGTSGSGTASLRLAGGPGGAGTSALASAGGGAGGNGPFGGGAGVSRNGVAGGAGAANTGGGGAGGGGAASVNASGGGGSGEYVELLITSPSATYTYTVGTGGTGGTAGASGFAGGAGGSGIIIVDEFYV